VDAANSISVIDDFLRAALALMERKAVGIFNLVNPGAISHRELLDIYQAVSGKRLSVEFISAPELDQLTRARRSNCVLSTAKLEAIGIAMPEVKQAVRHCIESYVDAEARESFRRAA
jgi:dTDP-4-dehydrorhamnose reductase